MAYITKDKIEVEAVKIPIDFLKEGKLNLKEKGLYIHICSLPENWNYSILGMSRICADGVDAIRSAQRKLVEKGFITISPQEIKNGYKQYKHVDVLDKTYETEKNYVLIPLYLCKGLPSADIGKIKKDKSSLTLSELALWAILYSLAPGWKYTDTDVAKIFGGNSGQIRNARAGLIRKGYITVTKHSHLPNGQYVADDYHLNVTSSV